MTILVACELRHYATALAGRIARPLALGLFACMWPVIWIRTLMGKMLARITTERKPRFETTFRRRGFDGLRSRGIEASCATTPGGVPSAWQ